MKKDNKMSNTDEIVLYNTDEQIKIKKPTYVETFDLVPPHSPILRQKLPLFDFKNPPVNPIEFASSLVETCKKYNGLGLSANQCGFNYRVFVMGSGDEYVAYFNPELLQYEGEDHVTEGCLSFPLLNIAITRPKKVSVTYLDFDGKQHHKIFDGITARCFLHELDHMNGIVYTDRAKPLALEYALKKVKKIQSKLHKAVKGGKLKPEQIPTL
jgi:peptide deformylase